MYKRAYASLILLLVKEANFYDILEKKKKNYSLKSNKQNYVESSRNQNFSIVDYTGLNQIISYQTKRLQ